MQKFEIGCLNDKLNDGQQNYSTFVFNGNLS